MFRPRYPGVCTHHSTSRRQLLSAAALGSLALLTGCGKVLGGADSAATSGASHPTTPAVPTSAAPAPPPPPPPVTFSPPYAYGTPQATVPPIANGRVPVIKRIETDQPFIFLTIDDGAVQAPEAAGMFTQNGIRPSLCLNNKYVDGHEDYFLSLQQAGGTIQSHTVTHPNLEGEPYSVQFQEINANADSFAATFGARPTFLRPPFGNYDDTTLVAAADAGLRAAVTWTCAVNDGVVQFQVGDRLRPGDIVLMHFRDTFVMDFQALVDKALADGMTPVPLEDFLAV